MQDVEFTVQEGKLFMLQTRSGKRTAEAALKAAVDMVGEGLIDKRMAIGRVEAGCAGPVAASHPRSRRAQGRDRRRAWRLARRRHRRSGVHGGRSREAGGGKARRHSGARRNQPGRHSRHACRQGHSHRARRHDQPRRGGGARHGTALRLRRRLAQDRCRARRDEQQRRYRQARRNHHHRWRQRQSVQGRGQDAPAGTDRRFRAP